MPQYPKVPGWTRGEHREIRPHAQNDLFKPLRILAQHTIGEVEVVRSVAAPCQSVVRKTLRTKEKEAMVDEIKTLKSLHHKHIIAVIATYQAANEYGILMFPVGDQNIDAFFGQLDSGNHQHKTWLHGWFSCIASALCYIHDSGLQHQQIAPKNIIHRGSNVYFTDFGLPTSTLATTAYSAPELQPSRCSDLFSLGCVYLEMLTALDSRSVKDFRARCHQSVRWSDPTFFRYYSALSEIKKLFSYRCFDDQALCDSWGRTILPMLDPSESARPDAHELLRRLQTEDLLPTVSTRLCACQSPEATNPADAPEELATHLAELGEMPDSIPFFEIRNNTASNFQIDLVQPARCQPWHSLEATPSFEYKSHTFHVGDFVWIQLSGEPRELSSLAKIVEARAVGDGT